MHDYFPKSQKHLLSNSRTKQISRLISSSNFTHSEHDGVQFNLNPVQLNAMSQFPPKVKFVKGCESDLLTQVEKAREEYL